MGSRPKAIATVAWHVKRTEITEEEFENLLRFLDDDRDVAARRYLDIQSRLVRILRSRGAPHAEDLAQETLNRVAEKSGELAKDYKGDPAHYCLAVARNVLRESWRMPNPLPMPDPDPAEEKELHDRCLERCLDRLLPKHRELILKYYRGEKRPKIELRKELADRWGLTLNALRIRACRIRKNLEKCFEDCIELNAVA